MNKVTALLPALALLLGSSVASANAVRGNQYSLPIADETVDMCFAKADLHMSLARSAGYELAWDLSAVRSETATECLSEAGLDAATAHREAYYYFCDVVASLSGGGESYGVCEAALAELNAERAP